jgi:hypothetical protein
MIASPIATIASAFISIDPDGPGGTTYYCTTNRILCSRLLHWHRKGDGQTS